MPWTLEEKHGRAALKRVLLAVWAALVGVPLFTAWLTWDVWAAARDGERTIASAKQSYQIMIALVVVCVIVAAVRLRDAAPHPPESRRLFKLGAASALLCAAIPLAATLALPAG